MTLDTGDGLAGAYVPLVVPFDGGAVDFDAYARLCEWQIDKGIHGLLVNATSGEPTTLTREERAQLVDVAQDVSAGRCPVCAGTASQSHEETIALLDHYQKRGLDSVFVVTPYYCKPPQRALIEFFTDVAKRTDRPLLIYHIPGRAAVRLTADTIVAIKDRAENFAGIKNTDNDLGLITEVLQRLGDNFRIFSGWEPVSLPMLAVGACGTMLSVSNVVPDRVAQLCEMSASGDLEGAKRLNDALCELFAAIDYDTSPIATKYMLKRIGVLETNEHRLPMTSATPELEQRLDAVLARAGLI